MIKNLTLKLEIQTELVTKLEGINNGIEMVIDELADVMLDTAHIFLQAKFLQSLKCEVLNIIASETEVMDKLFRDKRAVQKTLKDMQRAATAIYESGDESVLEELQKTLNKHIIKEGD